MAKKAKRPQLPKKPKVATEIDKAIGSRLRLFRLRQKMSQADLGAALGVTFQQIQKYENGKNRLSGSKLIAVCDALKCSSTELLATGSDRGLSTDQFNALHDRKTSNLFLALAKLSDVQRSAVIEAASAMVRGFVEHA